MKQIPLTILMISLSTCLTFAQGNAGKNPGTFYGDAFLNYNYSSATSQSSFRLNRLHLGYKYQFTDNLYFNGMIESAREDYEAAGDYNGITNLFEICLGFKFTKLEGKFGLIGTELNQQQEKLWKHRYIDKVYADKYGFAPTNDFGLLLIFKPVNIINLDLAITNGEGHKTFQADSTFRYAAGITIRQGSGIVARLYGDVVTGSESAQSNLIGILGYETGLISVGLEWNKQFNNSHFSGHHRGGFSSYLSYNISEKYQAFGRYDYHSSNKPENLFTSWNINNDGQLAIAGVQYKLHKQINLALDYRAWIREIDREIQSYVFFDLELSF